MMSKRDPRLSSIERMAEAMGMTMLIVPKKKPEPAQPQLAVIARSGATQHVIARSGATQHVIARSEATRHVIARSEATRRVIARSEATRRVIARSEATRRSMDRFVPRDDDKQALVQARKLEASTPESALQNSFSSQRPALI